MSKKWFKILLVFLLILPNFSMIIKAEETSEVNEEWELVWSDEFEGNELDLDKWTIDTGNGFFDGDTFIPGWGNEELQYYHEDNVRVEDGKLILEGRKKSHSDLKQGTFDFTSGKIHTQGKFSQKYGRFEAKMSLPKGQGYWPAFWMMPEDDVYGGWAASGEIDIMESAGGRPDHIGGAIHYGGQWPNNTYTAKDYDFPEGSDISDMNVYAVEWEPGEIRWYVNDVLFQTLNNWSTTSTGNPAKFAYPAPFDQEFYIILNLAIGGWYGGNPDETTPFPGEMVVDYVRVYKLAGRDYKEPVEPVFEPEELPDGAKEAVDGNYVYDSAYNNGFTRISTESEIGTKWNSDYWNLVYLDTFNGSASATVETINGDPFAKVEIIQAGNQPYSVQLIQNVTVGKGRWYKLSFDAKSSSNRKLNVKIGGGPERGFTAYSPNTDFDLTNELQSYELIFQMQQDSDALARLELNMGLNTNPVWIGDVKLEEVTAVDPYNEEAPKRPLRNGNHVYNGTFDQGRMDRMTFWNFDLDDADAMASVHPDARELAVAITDGGSSVDSIKLVQTGMNLLPNDEYKVTFDARAAADRDIEVALLSKDGSVNYSSNQVISLTTEMTPQEMTFVMPNIEDIEGQLVFLLGGNNSDVVIDNVKMVRLTNNNASVSIEQAFPLKNGDFSNGLEHWNKHYQGQYDGPSSATFIEESEKAKITVGHTGTNPWDISLSQEGLTLIEGLTYVVEFEASSTIDRKIEVVIDNGAPSYHRYLSETIDLSTDTELFSFELVMPTTDVIGLKFLVGAVESLDIENSHDIVIDNVKLEVKGERERYFPLNNGDFGNGLEDWYGHYEGQYDGLSSATFVEEIGKAKITVEHTGTNPWDISLSQEGLTLEEGLTYIVEFDASVTIDRKVELVIDNGAPSYHRYLSELVELTIDAQTFSYELEMPTTDRIGLKFLLGSVDDVVITDSHDIFIDNVRLEVKGAREVLSGSQDGEEPTEPTEPEVPFDPTDKEWKEVGENLIVDGTFDTTTEFGNPEINQPWKVHNQGLYEDFAGLADFSVVEGVLNANVKQVGWYWWQIQLFQDIEVPAGIYKIAFDMQSDNERIVRVELAETGTGIHEFPVGSSMETYETIVEVTNSGKYKFLFGLGKQGTDPELTAPNTILIDNVRLVEVKEVTETTEPGNGEEPGDGAEPVTPTPTPQPETPGKVVVNNPQADKGKVSVVIGKDDKVVMLPSQAAAINRNNKVIIERDDFSMEVPGAVLESLKGLGKGDPNSKISVSFEKLKKEVIENNLVEQGSLKKAGIRVAGDIFEFNLSVVDIGGKENKLSSFAEPIRVKLRISDDANLDLVGIYKVEENGQLTYVGGDVDGQTISTNLYSFSKYAVLEYDKSYEDVPQDFWAHDTIKKLSSRHIINGYTNGDFAPRKAVTRAEFASMLVRALSLKTDETVIFIDVANTDWYAKDIAAAYQAGIIKGMGNQKFAPNEMITREQMTAMVVRAYELVNGPIGDVEVSKEFVDEHSVSAWAKGSVKQAAHLKLVNGRGNGTFSPLESANRAESAQIIYNLLFN